MSVFLLEDISPAAGAVNYWRVINDQSRLLYAGNRLHRLDHALLHCGHCVAAVTGHGQVCIDEHRVPRRVEAVVAVQRARQSTHRNHRRSNQHRANRNLHTEQHSRTVIRRPTLPVDPDLTIWYGSVLSTWRTGTIPKRNPLAKSRIQTTRGRAFRRPIAATC